MITEWVNTSENLPHKTVSDAYTALELAKIRTPGINSAVWGPIDATGRVGQPYGKPAAGVWPPVYPPVNQWTIDNVYVGNYSLREMFAADSDFLPRPDGGGVGVEIPDPITDPYELPPVVTPSVLPAPGLGVSGITGVTKTTAVATPDEPLAVEGDVIGTRLLAFARYAGAPVNEQVLTKSLYQIAELLSQGYGLLRSDGTLAVITEFMGGVLADGEPLTVWLGRGWLPGQQQALIDAGITPITDLGKVFSQAPSPLIVGGAIAAAVFFFMRRRKK